MAKLFKTIAFHAICLIVLLAVQSSAQIYADDTLFIGNPDGSPFHVPYQGVVDIPVWMNPYGVGGGTIDLRTLNYAVSERLGGNFYFPWLYIFSEPVYYPDFSRQVLGFISANPPDSIVHMADFSFRMDIDPSYIGDTLQIMYATGIFSDSTGTIIFLYWEQISQLVIDDLTSNEEVHNAPQKISLLQNYPNPFNAATTIRYTLPFKSEIKLSIYNLLGQQVETLFEGVQNPGEHTFTWDAFRFPSGIYFARLETRCRAENIKMVLLK